MSWSLSRDFLQLHYTPIAPVATLIVKQRRKEVAFVEVRPKRISDVNLSISNLPQQEIAYAHLAAGSDQQVRIGQRTSVKISMNGLFVYLFRINASRGHVTRNSLNRVHNFGSTSVVERDA